MNMTNQKIKIILSYYHNKQTIMVPIYKTLSYVRDKVFNIFYPISGEIILVYNGMNLNDSFEKQLGLIFPDQSTVKINIIKSKKNNLINSQSSIYKIYGKKKLPPITIKSRTKSPKVKSNKILCYECFKESSFIFCRECNKFLCNNCFEVNHFNHIKLDLLDDEKLNLIVYKDKMLKELKESSVNFEKIENLKNKEIDVEKWGTIFTEKIDNIKNVTLKIQDSLSNKIYKSQKINVGNNIDDVYYLAKHKLDNINDNNIKDPLDLFLEINKSEREIKRLFHDSILLNKKDSLKTRIEKIYSRIEDEIERILQEIEYDEELTK